MGEESGVSEKNGAETMSIRAKRMPKRRVRDSRCPPGYKWIPPHTKNGSYVRGHCAKIGNPSRRSITRQTTTTYGWERGPVIKREITESETVNEESGN